nr:RNA-directed DNA polymerase, eukaryota, nucleotide-binding alpha-beta plait domain protein [Tanacetum cinerariifolium]
MWTSLGFDFAFIKVTRLSRSSGKVCSDYGTVIDVYIPLRKSKAGKRFAFVRFIKVVNLDRLIENLCTVWIGRFRLYANVVRFHKNLKPSVWKPKDSYQGTKPGVNVGNFVGSFASVHKKRFPKCESHLGGLWVLIDLVSNTYKEKFSNHVGICSWFDVLKPACDSFFFCDERIAWISIEGLPLKASSSSDGESFGEDDGQVSGTKKQDKVNNDDNEVDRVSETSFGYEQEPMHGNLNKLPVDEVHSEDPFKIYDISEKKKENIGHSSEEEPKFPPGFTPIDKDGEEEVAHHIDRPEILENNMEPGISNDTSQRCKNLFSKVQNSSSFLDVMDELVKVGQTMGYNMEGCMNNIEAIIGSQGDGGDGFDKLVKNSWKNSNLVETNGMVLLKKKLQLLKEDIKLWSKEVRKRSSDAKLSIKILPRWISSCLHNATGSVLVNGSPSSSKFCFHKGLKQGDPLSPFLFILIMESLHVSFGKIMDAGLFKETSSMVLMTQSQFLCVRVIKSIYGANGALEKPNHNHRRSLLLDILREASALKLKGIDLYAYIHKKVGNGEDTLFWEDHWLGENVLRIQYLRFYALETCKSISVADKMKHDSLSYSFRHPPRGGAEDTQFGLLNSCLANLLFPQMRGR